MRAPHMKIISLYILCVSHLSTSQAITLSDFQQVSGFSQACTDAYNTPLTGCAATDFSNGNACSSNCIEFLKKLTVRVNQACKGTITLPGTLMGMFFSGEAVAKLCPNVPEDSDPLPGAAGEDGTETGSIMAGSATCTSSVTSLKPTAAESPSSIATTNTGTRTLFSTLASSVIHTVTSSALAPPDTSTTLTLTATESDPTPTILPPESTIPLSVLTGSSSKSATAVAQTTPSNQNSNGKSDGTGGGTLFDLASSSCRTTNTRWWVGSIPAAVLILACLL